jgi:hypothetical protein
VPLSQLCRTTGAVPLSVTGAGWLTTNGQVIRQGSAGSQVLSGCTAILMDQAAEDVDAFDAAGNWQRGYRRGRGGHRNVEIDAAVGTGRVVVLEIPGEDTLEVLPAPDQCPVQTFGADGAHPSLGVRVRLRRPRRDLDRLDTGRGEHRVERGREFGVPVANQKPEPVCLVAGSGRGAVLVLRPVRFPDPPSEPAVRLSPQRALHVSFPSVSCR